MGAQLFATVLGPVIIGRVTKKIDAQGKYRIALRPWV